MHPFVVEEPASFVVFHYYSWQVIRDGVLLHAAVHFAYGLHIEEELMDLIVEAVTLHLLIEEYAEVVAELTRH